MNGAEATSAAGRLSSSSMTLLLVLLDGIALESRACGMAGTKACLKVRSADAFMDIGIKVLQARLVHERILGILAAQPGLNGQLSCLHNFKIF